MNEIWLLITVDMLSEVIEHVQAFPTEELADAAYVQFAEEHDIPYDSETRDFNWSGNLHLAAVYGVDLSTLKVI